MYGVGNTISEFVKRSKKTKQLSEARGDSDGKYGIPDKESNNGMFSNCAFFPSDFRMCKISDDGGNCSGDKVGEPNKVVVFNDKIG